VLLICLRFIVRKTVMNLWKILSNINLMVLWKFCLQTIDGIIFLSDPFLCIIYCCSFYIKCHYLLTEASSKHLLQFEKSPVMWTLYLRKVACFSFFLSSFLSLFLSFNAIIFLWPFFPGVFLKCLLCTNFSIQFQFNNVFSLK